MSASDPAVRPMSAPMAALLRQVYRRELIPVRLRWWLAAAGMCDWYRTLAARLPPFLSPNQSAQRLLAQLSVRMFVRRYQLLRGEHPGLPDLREQPRSAALLFAQLYRLGQRPKAAWIVDGLGGGPRGTLERLSAETLLWKLPTRTCWEELTTHLGELLIVLTEDLPAMLPAEHQAHTRKILGDICFAAGVRFAETARASLRLPAQPADPAAAAIEVLRMSEYVFRVNPEHHSATQPAGPSGWLEGSACPWYTRPGWHAAHCGIFGQFQSGVSSVFGLRYQLAQTIPKHGGSTCRIDLKPIPLRLRPPEGPGPGRS